MINILAYHFNGYGSIGGICKEIYLSDLQYNRPNFRDKYKINQFRKLNIINMLEKKFSK